MRHLIQALLAAAIVAAVPAFAQAPEIRFDSVANALQLPAGIYFGEVAGVATNSRGDVFVYTRTGHPTVTIGTARPFVHGGSRLFQFDRTGKFLTSWGEGLFVRPHGITIAPDDTLFLTDDLGHNVREQNRAAA